MTFTPEEDAAIKRKLDALESDPWFLSLTTDEERCEAYTIATMIALHDHSRDIAAHLNRRKT